MEPVDQVLAVVWRSERRRRRGHDIVAPTAVSIHGALEHEVAGERLDAAIHALAEAGVLVADGEGWWIAEAHHERARAANQAVSAAAFGEWMVACEESPAYHRFCARVNQLPFVVFDMLDAHQLDAAVAAARLGPGKRALDLGCGIGTITEHVARTTGAAVHGVDFAPAAIARARERTSGVPGLTFDVAALDDLQPEPGAWDAIFAFDTLYFVEDLDRLVRACARGLRPGGRLVAFFTALDAPADQLLPDSTRLAAALRDAGLGYVATEHTEAELALWRRAAEAVRDLKAAFDAEGAHRLWITRQKETEAVLPLLEEGRARRTLYVVSGMSWGQEA